jgi:hypothetical protein
MEKATRNVEQRCLVPSPEQCPCLHDLECAAVFGKKKKSKGYPSSSLFTRPCAMRLFMFARMKCQMKGKRFADVSKVKKETLEVLDIIGTEEFQKCFQQWGKRWCKCFEAKGEHFEGD